MTTSILRRAEQKRCWRRKFNRTAVLVATVALAGCLAAGPSGNFSVPEPTRSVEIDRYTGLWYELARYENAFEKGCEGVTAEYTQNTDGTIEVVNTCRKGTPSGSVKSVRGKARAVGDTKGAKFKISFFGPFYVGNYWILDRAPDYSWSIVGEPSGRFLWLLSRTKSKSALAIMTRRAKALGYDISMLRITDH